MIVNQQMQQMQPRLDIDQQFDEAIDFLEKKSIALVKSLFSQVHERNIAIGILFTASVFLPESDDFNQLDLTKISLVFLSSVFCSALIDKINI